MQCLFDHICNTVLVDSKMLWAKLSCSQSIIVSFSSKTTHLDLPRSLKIMVLTVMLHHTNGFKIIYTCISIFINQRETDECRVLLKGHQFIIEYVCQTERVDLLCFKIQSQAFKFLQIDTDRQTGRQHKQLYSL